MAHVKSAFDGGSIFVDHLEALEIQVEIILATLMLIGFRARD
jgi:hypothetical protein